MKCLYWLWGSDFVCFQESSKTPKAVCCLLPPAILVSDRWSEGWSSGSEVGSRWQRPPNSQPPDPTRSAQFTLGGRNHPGSRNPPCKQIHWGSDIRAREEVTTGATPLLFSSQVGDPSQPEGLQEFIRKSLLLFSHGICLAWSLIVVTYKVHIISVSL